MNWNWNWHYPLIGGHERGYQTEILQSALFKNSLICLSTGMGKTYIALVLLYNYARWFPHKKGIFMAPTRPLVTQQHRSWKRLLGKLQGTESIEISATMPPERRAELWQGTQARIIFTTPQIVENDLENGHVQAGMISCLVFDEAHRAVGNYAYCGVMRLMQQQQQKGNDFQVCALTATPGSNVAAVQALIDVLQIEQVHFFNEDSPELKPFVSLRQKEVVLFGCSPEIEEVLGILDGLIKKHYTQPLQQSGYPIPGDIEKISVTSLLQEKNRPGDANRIDGAIEGYLAGLRIMLHLRDLLLFYGILPTVSYIRSLAASRGSAMKTRVIKQLMQSDALVDAMKRFEALVGRDSSFYSHPKLKFLSELLLRHFSDASGGSDAAEGLGKVMIFSQYRDSVLDICEFLHRFQPRIRPASLLGLSKGQPPIFHSHHHSRHQPSNRAYQQTTLDRFMAGETNVLVTTSIGEEGLDIGAVDLIIFFDAQSSPIRLVQRSGRTGRQREGKIVFLLGRGKEEQLYLQSEASSAALARALSDAVNTFRLHSVSSMMANQNATMPFKFTLVMNDPDVADSSAAVNGGASSMKRQRLKVAPVKPDKIPRVNPLSTCRSIVAETTAVSIEHSATTLELIKLSKSLESDRSRKRKRCQKLFQEASMKMPIFKLFNYEHVPLSDYQMIYRETQRRSTTTPSNTIGTICNDNHQHNQAIDFPDDFFDDDELVMFDLDLDEEVETEPIGLTEELLGCGSSLDNSISNLACPLPAPHLSFDHSLPIDDDTAALEQFDWSDSDI